MKIILSTLLVLALLSGSAMAQLEPILDITLTSQDPFPVEPGDTMEIEVEIQNSGFGQAKNVVMEILETSPFSLVPGQEKIKTFQSIPSSSSVKTTYNIFVSNDAVSGTYDLSFRITHDGVFTEKVQISVQGKPKLIIDKISTDPEKIEAGGLADISIYIRNVGSGTARDLTLTLNATDVIIPVLSNGIVYLGDLPPEEPAVATMKLSVDDTADEKTYIMKMHAEYTDESGQDISNDFDIGIPVSGTVKLDIIKIEPDYVRGLLDIEVANKGTAEAKSVEAKLYANGELIDIDYISQLKPSKKTTFSFPLVLEGTGVLEINYIGPGLEENILEKDVVFSFQQNGSQSSDPTLSIVLVVAIVGIGYYYWRRRKKKKK